MTFIDGGVAHLAALRLLLGLVSRLTVAGHLALVLWLCGRFLLTGLRCSRGAQISKEEWALEMDVEETLKVLIAKARWVYHCERCNIDHGKRKRMNLEIVMQRLDRRMKVIEAP